MSDLSLDDELVQDYLAECREHLATIETDLLTIEQGGAEIDEQLVNRVFRAAHSVKGGAGFFDLVKIRELAHKTENALDLIRSRQMVPTPEVVSILLLAFDKLRELIGNHRESIRVDSRECAYVSYEYDSRSVNHEWRQVSDGVRGLAYHRGEPLGEGVDPAQGVELRAYREKTQQYARNCARRGATRSNAMQKLAASAQTVR